MRSARLNPPTGWFDAVVDDVPVWFDRASFRVSTKPSTSATVTVQFGWVITPKGSSARTGSTNEMHTPRSSVVANVTPLSAIDKWAGPATFHQVYGPVTATSAMLETGVVNDQGPNNTVS
jgi:hypothetical protein